jgi:hypothetical protein
MSSLNEQLLTDENKGTDEYDLYGKEDKEIGYSLNS